MDVHAPHQAHCPQCGAPAPFRGTTVSLVCEFCGSTIVRTGVDIQLIGRVSALIDTGSPILLGGQGRWQGQTFQVVGRLQVVYERGRWNEWYIEFSDGSDGWLTDAQGQYSIVRGKNPAIVSGRVPVFHAIATGVVLTIDQTAAVVVDRRGAMYRGAEGALPFAAQPGQTFYGVDLRGFNGEFISLDYGSDPNHASPRPYIGQAIDILSVGLRPLRSFSGWRSPTTGGALPGRS